MHRTLRGLGESIIILKMSLVDLYWENDVEPRVYCLETTGVDKEQNLAEFASPQFFQMLSFHLVLVCVQCSFMSIVQLQGLGSLSKVSSNDSIKIGY